MGRYYSRVRAKMTGGPAQDAKKRDLPVCPFCGAAQGKPCVTPQGAPCVPHEARLIKLATRELHRSRIQEPGAGAPPSLEFVDP